MQRIDGGAGGGQLVRLAVTLAAIEGTSIEIEDVRGKRTQAGLRPQHVAAIKAVASISQASYDGVTVGSDTVRFDPGTRIGGKTSVEIGTAGSLVLLFDAVLPLAVEAAERITVRAKGGTDVKWAPPLDYLQSVKRPILESHGLEMTLSDIERGFYPRGSGAATLELEPSNLGPIRITDRGDLQSIKIRSIETADLADASVAQRQIEGTVEALPADLDVPITKHADTVVSESTGTVLTVAANYEQSVAGFSALGEPGVPAEVVGEQAADAFRSFESGRAAIDSYMADQLLPFVALNGGSITIPQLTDHVRSEAALLEQFGYDIVIEAETEPVRIAASPEENQA